MAEQIILQELYNQVKGVVVENGFSLPSWRNGKLLLPMPLKVKAIQSRCRRTL